MSRSEIEQQQRRWVDAFNRGDAATLARCHTDDTRLLRPAMPPLEGRDALEASYKAFLAANDMKMAFHMFRVHEGPELCAAVGRFEIQAVTENESRTLWGNFVEVWARQADGEWLIADHIFNNS